MFDTLGVGFYICIAAVILVGVALVLYVLLYVNRKGKTDSADAAADHTGQENEQAQQTEAAVTKEAPAKGEAAADETDAAPADSFVIVKDMIVTGTDEKIS